MPLSESHRTIPSYQSFYTAASNDPLSPNPLYSTSPSRFPSSYFDNHSEYEVVLDDGTRQRRTVSLSTTVPRTSFMDHIRAGHERRLSAAADTCTETTALLSDKQRRRAVHDVQSSDSEIDETPPPPKVSRTKPSWFALSHKQKMVLKCSFAYGLGSLFTFVPALNELIGGPSVASHMAATVTVFFNPAKSVGGMVEAAGYGWIFTIAALSVSLGSLATSTYLHDLGHHITACVVTLGFWLAGSTFIIAFLKAHVNKPSLLTAEGSGLAFIVLFSILVKQGSSAEELDTGKIRDTFTIVAIGTAISVAVCLLVWPMTATKKLKSNIDASLQSMRVLLKLLTKTFLLDADLPEFTANKSLEDAINSHRASFTALKSSLKDAKLEFYNIDMWRHAHEYDSIVGSLQRLAQHIGGLRSSCGLQFEAMQGEQAEIKTKKGYGTTEAPTKSTPTRRGSWNVKVDDQRRKFENELRREHSIADNPCVKNVEEEGALVQFIKTVRSPMKSLAYTCKHTIIHLQTYFSDEHAAADRLPFHMLRQNLAAAIALFEESLRRALTRMYQRKLRKHPGMDLHMQLMKQFPAEDIVLVYFFVFCLLEFAKELMCLVECVDSVFSDADDDTNIFVQWIRAIVGRWITIKERVAEHAEFVPNNHNTFNTLHTPKPTTTCRQFFLTLWEFFSWFRQHTVRYAIKATVIGVAVASLAFIPATQIYFREFRMEWTLITVMAVMTPTVGGTNVGAVLRVLATGLGCVIAAATYTLFSSNPIALVFLTWLFSIPCFWAILNHTHGRFGQFALLAYNLIVLYEYNHRMEEDMMDVFELAWMRCVAVSMGVLIGLIVTTYVWPYEARKELRKGLSDLLLHVSWLYKQLVSVYSETTDEDDYELLVEQIFDLPPRDRFHSPEELKALDQRNRARASSLQKIELSIQLRLVELQTLLVHAPNEPRLKGPFPVKTYKTMLTSCQHILDKFLSLRIVILKDVWALHVRRDFLLPASNEFMEMTGNVLLYFYILASALQLKTPLPPYLPPAEKARVMLMAELQKMPTLEQDHPDRDECYMAYYAYVVLMETIIRELDQLGNQMKDLFGTLVPQDQWARCFGRFDLEQQHHPAF
ncbi:hypothetical protein DFQ30_010299 [Apophysomyces sp. BC1015]|nr:hypothetical protein DFQ30_010299 [Apophysomyces sp. BC1015]